MAERLETTRLVRRCEVVLVAVYSQIRLEKSKPTVRIFFFLLGFLFYKRGINCFPFCLRLLLGSKRLLWSGHACIRRRDLQTMVFTMGRPGVAWEPYPLHSELVYDCVCVRFSAYFHEYDQREELACGCVPVLLRVYHRFYLSLSFYDGVGCYVCGMVLT